MRTLKIDISDSIYEHIMFFLKSVPSNLIHISDTKEKPTPKKKSTKRQVEELFETYRTVAPFHEIDDPIAWQRNVRDEWE